MAAESDGRMFGNLELVQRCLAQVGLALSVGA